MKEGIHPNYVDATVRCACGEVINTKSTKGDFRVEICSKCHPFFTGKQKFVDAGGRVDKFRKRLEGKILFCPIERERAPLRFSFALFL